MYLLVTAVSQYYVICYRGLHVIVPSCALQGDPNGESGSAGSGSSDDAGMQAAYLEFGRLLGEKPDDVKQGLQEAGLDFADDEQSRQYLDE